MTRTLDWSTGTFSNHGAVDWSKRSADEILDDMRRIQAEVDPMPQPSREVLEQAARLGAWLFGVPCFAGWEGGRFRIVPEAPVDKLDINVARMKLERWHPELAEVIELAAAGCWR